MNFIICDKLAKVFSKGRSQRAIMALQVITTLRGKTYRGEPYMNFAPFVGDLVSSNSRFSGP